MKLYLSGIKSYQLDIGIDCTAFSDPRLERTLHRIKRDHAEPERRIRTPLTRPLLLSILNQLAIPNYDNAVFKAAFTLALAGFLRVGEFTYRKADQELGLAFKNWFLTKSCVRFVNDRQAIDLTLPASKTDPFRHGVQLIIAASHDEACTVLAMKQLMDIDIHRPRLAPLFCIGHEDQLPFSREYVVQKLKELAAKANLGLVGWNGHSFRRGAATWAAEVGIPDTQIQILGRWKSETYKAYIDYSREKRLSLSRRFQQVHPSLS